MMREQPRSKENDALRALACGQLLTFGWREGMAIDEAKTYADEALDYAREAGNRKHESLLIAAYGRIVAANGSADEYVKLIQEALAVTDAESNPEGALLLTGLLCQAYSFAGLTRNALSANDTALDMIGDGKQGSAAVVLGLNVGQMVGFNVPHWIRCMRIAQLTLRGRFAEADQWLARVLQIDSDAIDLVHRGIPDFYGVELAWFRGDADAAERHAQEVSRHTSLLPNPYWSVLSRFCHGRAASIGGKFIEADNYFAEALEASRGSRAALEFEARILAVQADNLDRAGDSHLARQVATEALSVSRRRGDRIAECHASIVAARLCLRQEHSGYSQMAGSLLDRARLLIDETGAKAFELLSRSITA
jgi:adenylate cyclase